MRRDVREDPASIQISSIAFSRTTTAGPLAICRQRPEP
jgi:hypothetical protein